MKIGQIEVLPLAAESMGVRSLCTFIETPDTTVVLDPSAALAYRHPHEPHPLEYRALEEALERIQQHARRSEILTASHYHFDHVRPGATNLRYNLSETGDREKLYADKRLLVKDGRSNINPSQRRRAYYFERDLQDCANIEIADGTEFRVGNTVIRFSQPLHHGSVDSPMGYVLATTIEYNDRKVLFAPDVQGPIVQISLDYLLSVEPDLAIIGGPPIYLKRFPEEHHLRAAESLKELAGRIPTLVVDHHLLRDTSWKIWLRPIYEIAEDSDNRVLTMAQLAGLHTAPLEAERHRLYREHPPSAEFTNWVNATDNYKFTHRPPYHQ